METQTRTVIGGVSVLGFLAGSLVSAALLDLLQPLSGLDAPTSVCIAEIKVTVALFVASVIFMEPAKKAVERRIPSLAMVMRTKIRFSWPVLAALWFVACFGGFVFAFWSVADLLGGYNGYGFALARYPLLNTIHWAVVARIPYVGSLDKGVQASLFFGVACLGVVLLRSSMGFGRALRDALTLFAAPVTVVFELALWYYAPLDMSWHVTDYLWLGGFSDGGWRVYDYGGAYLISNWFVLSVALLLVAYRIPWLSLVSKVIWGKRGEGRSLDSETLRPA